MSGGKHFRMEFSEQSGLAMKRIEVPSEELALELQKHLQEKRLPVGSYDKGRRTLQFPDGMNPSEWSNLRGVVEKWAKGRSLEVSEMIRLLQNRPEQAQAKAEAKQEPKLDSQELKKKLDGLSPEKALERFNYLSSKSWSDLTDAEYQERLELAQRKLEKPDPKK
jgi:hypothetical protein